jgi:hypothetical protein
MVVAVCIVVGLGAALLTWALILDHQQQCSEKGTYTVCTRERLLYVQKIGETYHPVYECLEHAEEPCE